MSEARRVEGILNDVAGEVVAVLQARAWQSLVSATPVDTGFARSSWFPTVGSPLALAIERPASETVARRKASKQLAENRARSGNIRDSYKLGEGQVFISNPVKYVPFLNAGSSAQAPAMFVERAVEQAVASLRNFKPRRAV